jgi:hypothetical protein
MELLALVVVLLSSTVATSLKCWGGVDKATHYGGAGVYDIATDLQEIIDRPAKDINDKMGVPDDAVDGQECGLKVIDFVGIGGRVNSKYNKYEFKVVNSGDCGKRNYNKNKWSEEPSGDWSVAYPTCCCKTDKCNTPAWALEAYTNGCAKGKKDEKVVQLDIFVDTIRALDTEE